MKKILRFMKSQEAFPGITTIANSVIVYFAIDSVSPFSHSGTIIHFAVLETIAIASLVIGYIVWKKGGQQ